MFNFLLFFIQLRYHVRKFIFSRVLLQKFFCNGIIYIQCNFQLFSMEIFLSLGPRYALSYLYVHFSTNNSLQYSRIALNVNYTIAKNVSQQNIKNNNFFEVNTQFNVKLKKKKNALHYRWPLRSERWERDISSLTSGKNNFEVRIFEFLYI